MAGATTGGSGDGPMTPDELLRELEPLTHDARMRRIVEVGRRAATDARVATTMATLELGGWL